MRAERRFAQRMMSVPWQEESFGPGEVAIEVGLNGDVRIILNVEDLDHLRAVIESDDEARIS
jgi:hypothetical protein